MPKRIIHCDVKQKRYEIFEVSFKTIINGQMKEINRLFPKREIWRAYSEYYIVSLNTRQSPRESGCLEITIYNHAEGERETFDIPQDSVYTVAQALGRRD